MSIHKIAFTGGPCGGKSEVIQAVAEKLRKEKYTVIVVPETAAELIASGIIPNENYLHILMFQELVLNHQLVNEKNADTYANYINKDNDIIILYDRAVLDNAAYFPDRQPFDDMLKKYGQVKTVEIKYNTFKGSRNLKDREIYVNEYLFILKKEGCRD